MWIIFTTSQVLSGVGLRRNAAKEEKIRYCIDGQTVKGKTGGLGFNEVKEKKTGTVSKTFIDTTLKGNPERTAVWHAPHQESGIREWRNEWQADSTDKENQIKNDANSWAKETMVNPKYPLELLQRVITVSIETQKIVNALPKLAI